MSNLETAKDLGKGIYTKAEVDLSIKEISVESVGSGVVSKSDVYSLDEVKTDKLYLGKPVYRKVCRVNIEDNSLIENHYYQISEILDIDNISELSSLKEVHDNNNIEIFKENYLMLFYGLVRGTQIQEWLDNGETIHGNISDGLWFKPSITHAYYNNFEITVEYTKTTDTIQEPEALNIIQSEMPSYSTEEVLTTERWIDGKPIYRKVISGVLDTTDDMDILTGLSNVDSCNIASYSVYDGIYTYNAAGSFKESDANEIRIYVKTDGSEILINLSDGLEAFDGALYDITLEYTKTTDTSESPVAQLSIAGNESNNQLTYDVEVTVHTDGSADFISITDALIHLSSKYTKNNVYSNENINANIIIKEGSIITETLKFNQIDLGWITLSTDAENNTITVNADDWLDNQYLMNINNNSYPPLINLIFDFGISYGDTSDSKRRGIRVNNNSTIIFKSNSGLIGLGSYIIYSSGGSNVVLGSNVDLITNNNGAIINTSGSSTVSIGSGGIIKSYNNRGIDLRSGTTFKGSGKWLITAGDWPIIIDRGVLIVEEVVLTNPKNSNKFTTLNGGIAIADGISNTHN